MFIERGLHPFTNSVRRSGMVLSDEARLEFRSSERSVTVFYVSIYKHFTPNGVKPVT